VLATHRDSTESANLKVTNRSKGSSGGLRATIIERIMNNVFGSEKDNVYNKYPHIHRLTVQNEPTLTPRGQEIINRDKYMESVKLLNEIIQEK